jgi:GT2 family glycosyltransferase
MTVKRDLPESGDKPVASVIVPTRDRARMLDTCLRSLIAQEIEEDYEIVVVENGSSVSAAVVESVQAAAGRHVVVRYLRQDSLWANAARNRGCASAHSDLLCLVDDDTEVPPGWLAALVQGARTYPQAGALGGPILLRIEGDEPLHCRTDQLPETQLDRGSAIVWDQKLWGANLALRRSALDRVGPFLQERKGMGDEEEWEDRLLAAGGHTLYLPDAWLWHRRTQAELGRRYLMRRSYRFGYDQVPYRQGRGYRVTIFSEMTRVIRGLGHAALFGCFYGLLRACRHWGATRRLWTIRRSGPTVADPAPSGGVEQ